MLGLGGIWEVAQGLMPGFVSGCFSLPFLLLASGKGLLCTLQAQHASRMGFHPYMGCERACSPQGLLSGPCGVACKGRAYGQVQTCITSDMSLLVNGACDGTPVQVLSTMSLLAGPSLSAGCFSPRRSRTPAFKASRPLCLHF